MPRLEIDLELPLDTFDLRLDLSLEVSALGVFGRSGSGKSSLLESVAGLRSNAVGTIRFDGRAWLDSADGTRLRPEARRVGYVPQDDLLFPHLDVRGNLLSGRRGGGEDEVFDDVCRLLELGGLLGRSPAKLSGGERQRVALGRAVCSRPDLLLLDEPLGSLDLGLRRRILPYLRALRFELGLPMVFVSHDPLEIEALCDEVIVIEEGRLLAQGRAAEVLLRPDVMTLAVSEWENVLEATVEVADEDGEARLRVGPHALHVSPFAGAAGDRVLVAVAASEVIVAIGSPRGLSARNQLAAEVVEIRSRKGERLVMARLEGTDAVVAAAVTRAAVAELGLESGRSVVLLIKSTSCGVLAAEPGNGDGP